MGIHERKSYFFDNLSSPTLFSSLFFWNLSTNHTKMCVYNTSPDGIWLPTGGEFGIRIRATGESIFCNETDRSFPLQFRWDSVSLTRPNLSIQLENVSLGWWKIIIVIGCVLDKNFSLRSLSFCINYHFGKFITSIFNIGQSSHSHYYLY